MFEKAKWIAGQNDTNTTSSPLFRKNILIKSKVKSATLNACDLGYGVYSLNGAVTQ